MNLNRTPDLKTLSRFITFKVELNVEWYQLTKKVSFFSVSFFSFFIDSYTQPELNRVNACPIDTVLRIGFLVQGGRDLNP